MTPFTRTRRRLFASLACAPLLLAGCGGSDSSGPPSTFTLVGTFAGTTGRSGSVVFIVAGTAVTGTLKVVAPTAATASMTGTYNTSERAISASGGGYTFAGVFTNTGVSGSFDGPSGSMGSFLALVATANARAICGTFTSTTGQASGVFDFSINGTTLSGTMATNEGTFFSEQLNGTVSASGAVSVDHPSFGAPLATGTLTGTTASGTFNDRAGNQGTWTGSVCS